MNARRFLSAALLLSLVLAAATAWASPAGDLCQKKEKVIRGIVATQTTPGTPAHQKKEDQLRVTINEMFDFEELGTRSLAFYWDTLTDTQKRDFLDTLKALIEKNYLLKITKTASYQVKWYADLKEEEWMTVRFKVKSGKYMAAIQFRMIEKNGRWVVFDMLIDDVSLLENYRSQFNKIIRNEGFDKMLDKMKRKLQELDANPSGKIENDRFDDAAPAAPNPAPATTP